MENTKEVTVQIKAEDYNSEYYCTVYGFIPKSACTVVAPTSVEETEGEVKGYCIKRTPENAEVLNKWLNMIDPFEPVQYNSKYGTIYSVPVLEYGCRYLGWYKNEVLTGFRLMPTVSEFFEKVGYAPEPKLIAKAGEWVKLISTKGEHALKVNMPVKLVSNYREGDYIQLNGYSYTAEFIKNNDMVFESCPTPKQPIGVYEGVEIFEHTKAWDIDLTTLKVRIVGERTTIEGWDFHNEGYSKVYLTSEEANKRLKEEVANKAAEISFTLNEYNEWFNNTCGDLDERHVFDFCIWKVEKEFSITYLTERK